MSLPSGVAGRSQLSFLSCGGSGPPHLDKEEELGFISGGCTGPSLSLFFLVLGLRVSSWGLKKLAWLNICDGFGVGSCWDMGRKKST